MRLLSILPSFVAACSALILPRGGDTGASHDLDQFKAPNWMSTLPDNARINALSIPGTHNTMTYSFGPADGIGLLRCQEDTITAQLNAGIRFLDIRLTTKRKGKNAYFRVVHGAYDTRFTFDETLVLINRWFADHPGEALLMRVKKENDRTDAGDFANMFTERYWPPSGNSGRFYTRSEQGQQLLNKLELGQILGKIVLIADEFVCTSQEQCFTWNDDTSQRISDNFAAIRNKAHMDRKFGETQGNVMKAIEDTTGTYMHISFTSGSAAKAASGYTPLGIASSPVGQPESEGQNWRTMMFLRGLKDGGKKNCGVVMMDFPGGGLVTAVLRMNEGYRAVPQ